MRIAFDGERIRVGDGPWDDGPVRQVRRNAEDVRQRLAKAGMGDVPVRGVVCYPGWGTITGSSGKQIWVLKPAALGKWIQQEERRVPPISPNRVAAVDAVVVG